MFVTSKLLENVATSDRYQCLARAMVINFDKTFKLTLTANSHGFICAMPSICCHAISAPLQTCDWWWSTNL